MGEKPSAGSPTVLRMILGRQLQALREKAGLSYEQAADAILSSAWTIRRMERAEGGLKPLTVKSLLQAYGVTDPAEIGTFVSLARQASKAGWWHSYDDVLPPWFKIAVGLEESASLIRAYQPQVVPGLLQTADYARAITAASFPAALGADTERRVALRLARQELLTRPGAPRYWVVLDETVLRRPVGGPPVMRAQISRLIGASALPNVTIQVIPFAAGWHPALYGMFTLFRFPGSELPDIVYCEGLTSASYLDKPAETARYAEALDRMCAQAASPDQTITILRNLMKET
ncbi:MAG TPA: helix-turn-helix transcriptional regulator [Streptosporangiaceae bacterium]|nr:helix-turn-helix transcriptional regulator [Streptosporangiaceae bacterium]